MRIKFCAVFCAGFLGAIGVLRADDSLGSAVVLAPTTPADASQDTSASDTEGLIIPAVPSVPKAFLPDIGIAGDAAFERNSIPLTDPRRNTSLEQPRLRDGQVVFFEPIDPYTKAQFTIDVPNGGTSANIEEAWIYFDKLPGAVGLRVGRFLPQFGLLDQLNTFQLSFLDRPNAIGDYIGSDGLNGTGLEANFYVPNPWDINLKVTLDAVQGSLLLNACATPNQDFSQNPCPTKTASQNLNGTSDLAYFGTLDYSRDLFVTGSFQAGASIMRAPSPFAGSETLAEPYMQIQYAPTERKIWTWSAEGMIADRQGLGTHDLTSGFYTYLDYNFALRYHVGLLVDDADLPGQQLCQQFGSSSCLVIGSPLYGRQLGLSPNFTWFVSDNTRLRVQYTHTTPLGPERADEMFALQATFSLGNLKQLQ